MPIEARSQDRRVLEPGPLGLGDVAGVDHQVVALVHREARRRHPHRDQLAGLGADLDRQVGDAPVQVDQRAQAVAVLQVVPEAEIDGAAADRLGRAVAGQAGERGVDQRMAAALELGQRDVVGAGREQLRQHRLRAPQRGLDALARGDVEQDRQRRRPGRGVDADRGGLDDDLAAVDRAGLVVGDRDAFADRHPLEHRQALADALAVLAGREQVDDRETGHPGRIGEAEQARGRVVGVEDQALAVQQQRRRRTIEELAVAGLARRHRALGADLLGDVAGDAPVAEEHAAGAEARLAADAVDPAAPVRVATARQQAAEAPMRLEVGPVLVELRLRQPDVRDLPGREPEPALQRGGAGRIERGADVGEAEVAVELPMPVGGDAQQAAVAPVALRLRTDPIAPQALAEQHAAHRREADQHQHQLDPLAHDPGSRQQQQHQRGRTGRDTRRDHTGQQDRRARRAGRLGVLGCGIPDCHARVLRNRQFGREEARPPGAAGWVDVGGMVLPGRRRYMPVRRRSAN